ncbi:MAG: hypothetical protein IIT65_02895, partial [Lachnospiraceae bacterium]|nr:hypothetical protein [Lachnospiraceae bacterium]
NLEELITEGTNAKVPIVIEFPDGKKAKAMIKPILTEDFKRISFNTNETYKIMTEVLKISLLNSNGEQLPNNLIDKLPIGVPVKIVEKIFEISGIETNPEDAEKLKEELELFP